MASFYATSSRIGVDLQNPGSTQLFALGETVDASNDSVWVYVQASTSVTAFKMVAYNTAGAMGMASAADIVNGLQLGVAQTAFASAEYGWVPIKGSPFDLMVTGSVTAGGPAYCALSGIGTGMCAASATASLTLNGIAILTSEGSAATSTTVCQVVLSYPKVKTPLSV